MAVFGQARINYHSYEVPDKLRLNRFASTNYATSFARLGTEFMTLRRKWASVWGEFFEPFSMSRIISGIYLNARAVLVFV